MTWRHHTGKHGSSAPHQGITQPTSWPHVASPTWSSTEQVARPATIRFHTSHLRPLEACCRPWTWWCNEATALAGHANLMMMMMFTREIANCSSVRLSSCAVNEPCVWCTARRNFLSASQYVRCRGHNEGRVSMLWYRRSPIVGSYCGGGACSVLIKRARSVRWSVGVTVPRRSDSATDQSQSSTTASLRRRPIDSPPAGDAPIQSHSHC